VFARCGIYGRIEIPSFEFAVKARIYYHKVHEGLRRKTDML